MLRTILTIGAVVIAVAVVAAIAIGLDRQADNWHAAGQTAIGQYGSTAAAMKQAAFEAEQRRLDTLAWAAVEATRTAVAVRVAHEQAAAQRWQPVVNSLPWLTLGGLVCCLVAVGVAVWRWGAGVLHRERVQVIQLQGWRDVQVEQARKPLPVSSVSLTDSRTWHTQTQHEQAAAQKKELEEKPGLPAVDLHRIARADNILIIGNKGSGKSTLMYNILSQRRGRLVMLDPHHQPGSWPVGVVVVGGGLAWDDIAKTINDIDKARKIRYERRSKGEPIGSAITFACDEWRAVSNALPGQKHVITDLITQGRKVRLCNISVGHGDTAESLGAKGEKKLFLASFDWLIYMGGFVREKVPPDVWEEIAQIATPEGSIPGKVAAFSTNEQQWYLLNLQSLELPVQTDDDSDLDGLFLTSQYQVVQGGLKANTSNGTTGTDTGIHTVSDEDIYRLYKTEQKSKNAIAKLIGGSKTDAYKRIDRVISHENQPEKG
jgi:hypothetical protein